MVKISQFVHAFELGQHIALWHSLRMKPVFLTKEVYEDLLSGSCTAELEQVLRGKKILQSHEDEDTVVLERIRNHVPSPEVSLCYFLLTERCNLACKYCFMGNNAHEKGISSPKDMSREVADKAIALYVRQLKLSSLDFSKTNPQIIFFGGEPLVAFDTLEYIAEKVNELRSKEPVLANVEMSMITNGTLLTRKRLLRLVDLGVAISISIDGSSKEANSMRVDALGGEAFGRILDVLDLCKEQEVKVGLSVTLTEDTVKDLSGMIDLLRKYDIKGFGYNIPMCNEEFRVSDEFYSEASQFIIESFRALRAAGVYEDRIMRKLISFSESQIYFSDCGATAGGQVVFTADGKVGLCHGLLNDEENFAITVDDETFNAKDNLLWQHWASLSPINRDECVHCEALGICGGGCPVNAKFLNPNEKSLQTLDERTCIHSKSTLKFLIEDLYATTMEASKTKTNKEAK